MLPKILFLDVDGVLNDLRSRIAYSIQEKTVGQFNPVTVAFINRLVTKHQFRIVVSSTWRYQGKERFLEKMKTNGWDIKPHLWNEWCTPKEVTQTRSEVINMFIKEHNITEFLIFDDEKLEGLKEEYKQYHIKSDTREGLTSENMQKVLSFYGDF